MSLTRTRILQTVLLDRIFVLSLLAKIVNFYYKKFVFHPNIFKFHEKMPINKIEHKNCLKFIKAVGSSNINFIY